MKQIEDWNKRIVLLGLFFLQFGFVIAQSPELTEINTSRLKINKNSMFVLGGWAVGNMLVGGIMRGRTTGTSKYFHEMNIFWNLVNLGFVGAGLYGSYSTDPATLSLFETIQEQQKLEKILLFNVALNVSYIAGGGWMIAHSKTADNNPERWKGYGQSLILQGSFLLLFDTAQVLVQKSATSAKIQTLLEHIQLNGQGIVLSFQF